MRHIREGYMDDYQRLLELHRLTESKVADQDRMINVLKSDNEELADALTKAKNEFETIAADTDWKLSDGVATYVSVKEAIVNHKKRIANISTQDNGDTVIEYEVSYDKDGAHYHDKLHCSQEDKM